MDLAPRLLLMLAIAVGTLVLCFWVILKSKCRFCHDLGYCLYDKLVWGDASFTRLNDWSNAILVQLPAYCCNHCSKGYALYQQVHGKKLQ